MIIHECVIECRYSICTLHVMCGFWPTQYERAVHRAMDMNALTQFAMVIFCGDLQYSKLIEAFSLPVKRVPQVEKVESIVFSKQGFRSHFRDCRIKDAEYAVRVEFACRTFQMFAFL